LPAITIVRDGIDMNHSSVMRSPLIERKALADDEKSMDVAEF